MAGNVTAAVRGQTLVLTGDATANKIAIVATDNNRYAVIGIDTDVNRSENVYVTTRTIRNIQLSLAGGDDLVLATNDVAAIADLLGETFDLDLAGRDVDVDALQQAIDDANPAEMFSIPGNLTILGGQGSDVVGIAGSVGGNLLAQLSDFGSDGANYFALNGLAPPDDEFSVGSGVTITGGSQADSVAIADARIQGRVTADLGNGANLFLATTSEIGTTLTYIGGTGADIVATGEVAVGSGMAVLTRAGDDQVFTAIETVGVTTVGRSLSIDTGAGADVVGVAGTVANSITVNTGDGDDEISMFETQAGGSIVIMAGSGDDLVEVSDIETDRVFQALLGLGNDVFTGATWTVNQSVCIDAGPGNDEVNLEDLTVERVITVLLGSGDDVLSIATSTAMSIYVSGGSGTDSSEIDDATRDAVDSIFESSIE
jgi:hypothetical protein